MARKNVLLKLNLNGVITDVMTQTQANNVLIPDGNGGFQKLSARLLADATRMATIEGTAATDKAALLKAISDAAEELNGTISANDTAINSKVDTAVAALEAADTANATAAANALAAKVGELGNASEAQGVEGEAGYVAPVAHTVKSYVDAKVAAANSSADDAIKALDADVTSDDETLVTVEVKEVDGKITDVVVADTQKATALRSDITDLQALHANKEGGGKQTVAEEVATGIANLRDGADAAFDTLKEIANWINDSDVNSEGFNAANRITTLQSAVGTEAVPNTAPEGEESNAKAATGLVKDVRELQAAVGAGGSVESQITNKINALDATVYGSMTADGNVREGQKVGVKVVETDGKLSEVVVATQDIASAALLGSASDAATAATAFGKIAKVAADLAAEVSAREAYNAPGAKKLVTAEGADVAVGDVNTPVYFANGVPVASTFTIKTSVPENAVFTDTTYEAVAATEGAVAGLMTSADKIKLNGISAGANKVEILANTANGHIAIDGTDATVYAHPTTSGNKHIPTGGNVGQALVNTADGTAAWQDIMVVGTEVPTSLAANQIFVLVMEDEVEGSNN